MRAFSLGFAGALAGAIVFVTAAAAAIEIRVPPKIEAGGAFTIQTSGTGSANFYLLGPSLASKRTIQLSSGVAVAPDEVSNAGEYRAVVCAGSDCTSAAFEVRAGKPARLSFFLHPSRVPVSLPNAIDATAVISDRYDNLVLAPTNIRFEISGGSSPATVKVVTTDRGIAWMRLASSSKAGAVRIAAVLGDIQEPRIIHQVAAEACGLRLNARANGKKTVFDTDPVRDCAGNPLPDGTIVSFTKVDASGKTTVDAPLKKGVAQVELPLKGAARISVACGVVVGNELSLRGAT